MFTASQAASYDAIVTAYPSDWDDEEERADAINERVNELIMDDYDAYDFDNLIEFLGNDYQTDEIQSELLNLIKANKDKLPKFIASLEAYWEAAAYKQAEHELEHP